MRADRQPLRNRAFGRLPAKSAVARCPYKSSTCETAKKKCCRGSRTIEFFKEAQPVCTTQAIPCLRAVFSGSFFIQIRGPAKYLWDFSVRAPRCAWRKAQDHPGRRFRQVLPNHPRILWLTLLTSCLWCAASRMDAGIQQNACQSGRVKKSI